MCPRESPNGPSIWNWSPYRRPCLVDGVRARRHGAVRCALGADGFFSCAACEHNFRFLTRQRSALPQPLATRYRNCTTQEWGRRGSQPRSVDRCAGRTLTAVDYERSALAPRRAPFAADRLPAFSHQSSNGRTSHATLHIGPPSYSPCCGIVSNRFFTSGVRGQLRNGRASHRDLRRWRPIRS